MSIAVDDRTAQAAELYVSTFAGRTDAYSVWTGDQWSGVRQPLTGDIVLKAFQTSIPLSAYVLNAESRGHVAAFDFDRVDGYELGLRVLRRMRELGGVAYIEKSRRGSHVWIVGETQFPGIVLLRALRALVLESELPQCPGGGQCPACTPPKGASSRWKPPSNPHPDPRIELRPESDRLPIPSEGDPPSLGKCLRMATMPHPLTATRYVLVSSEGVKLPGKLADMMLAIDLCPTAVIEGLAERGPVPKAPAPPLSMSRPYGAHVATTESASDILRTLWGALDAQPGKLIVCPAHDDHRPSLHVLKDDERAICFSPSCELHNNGRGRGTHELRALAQGRGR